MLLVMFVSLFTSRIVLEALGIDDFGVYNVIGGLASSFVFFSASLTGCTQRFINYELGRGSSHGANKVFNLSLLLYSVIAAVILIIGVTFGKWFVINKLVIPADRLDAAIQVLYATTLNFCTMFIFSVIEAMFIARENMKLYAYLGIIDVLLKLIIAYCITISSHKLVLYAWLMFAAQLVPKTIMAIYCIRHYAEAKIRLIWDSKLLKSLLGFTGWDIYSAATWMLNEQGINIVINMFFGPAVNAARGIATQVNCAVNNFNNNFFTAVRPQIIKRYAASEFESLKSLILTSTRMSVYLLWILSLPIILRCDYILSLWLTTVPPEAVGFVQWILIYSLVNSLNNPIWTGIQATGNLTKTIIYGSNLFILVFPASYLLIKWGAAPDVVYPVLGLGRIMFLSVAFHFLSKKIGMTAAEYLKKSILPIIATCLLTFGLCAWINSMLPQGFVWLILTGLITVIVNACMIYFMGISHTERTFIKSKVSDMLQRLKTS